MDDAGLGWEIMCAPEPVIVQPFRRTIGRAGNGARSVGAADDLGREMVDRHNGRYTALLSAGRQRCISAHSHSLPFACLTSPHFLIGTVPRARYRATLRLHSWAAGKMGRGSCRARVCQEG